MVRGFVDVHDQIQAHVLYHNRHATSASATLTGSTDYNEVVDVRGFDGYGMAQLSIRFDANCAAADSVTATIQKCTDTAGSNATTLTDAAGNNVAFSAVAGDGAAKTYHHTLSVPINNLGDYAAGTPYRYLRVSIALVDANSSGTFDIFVGLYLPGKYTMPVTQTAEES